KRFANGVLAVDRFNLDIAPGEFVSLLGPSGRGKSTILRILAELAAPSTGTVTWSGLPDTPHGQRRPDLGFVFQDPTLMPWTSAIGNVMLPLTLAHVPQAEARQHSAEMLRLV